MHLFVIKTNNTSRNDKIRGWASQTYAQTGFQKDFYTKKEAVRKPSVTKKVFIHQN